MAEDTSQHANNGQQSLLIIGAGLAGLAAAKVLSQDPCQFESITVFEKAKSLGGVWNREKIYDGLTTNSPLLTFEYPDWRFPEEIRQTGVHVPAQDVNAYLRSYAQTFGLNKLIQFETEVKTVEWNPSSMTWTVATATPNGVSTRSFTHIVICTGMYHTPEVALSEHQISSFQGNIYHSSEMGSAEVRQSLSESRNVVVVGAGKSALDLATLIARGAWNGDGQKQTHVSLVYRRPHWLSPRKMIRGLVPFEKILFSRFILAWQPFVKAPDRLHDLIANIAFGRWATEIIFKIVTNDFVRSLHQSDLPQTIPSHPLSRAVSGALHVEPAGYLDSVRNGNIRIVEGTVKQAAGNTVHMTSPAGVVSQENVDAIVLATGYRLSFPFFDQQTIQSIGLVSKRSENPSNLSSIRLHRLIAPPSTVHQASPKAPFRNIAFSGFAYSLLNPAVAHITAHWIADYFNGTIAPPAPHKVESEVTEFLAWQTATFGVHGAKGVHIGAHAPLYMDTLLSDMGLRSGHVESWEYSPRRLLEEWFRPMFPSVYASVGVDRQQRAMLVKKQQKASMQRGGGRTTYATQLSACGLFSVFILLMYIFFAVVTSYRSPKGEQYYNPIYFQLKYV